MPSVESSGETEKATGAHEERRVIDLSSLDFWILARRGRTKSHCVLEKSMKKVWRFSLGNESLERKYSVKGQTGEMKGIEISLETVKNKPVERQHGRR